MGPEVAVHRGATNWKLGRVAPSNMNGGEKSCSGESSRPRGKTQVGRLQKMLEPINKDEGLRGGEKTLCFGAPVVGTQLGCQKE